MYVCREKELIIYVMENWRISKNTNSINEKAGKQFKQFKMNTMARNHSFPFCGDGRQSRACVNKRENSFNLGFPFCQFFPFPTSL